MKTMFCFSGVGKSSSCSLVLLEILLLLFKCTSRGDAFNIDTKNVRVLLGQKGSHFGYSMSFDAKAFGLGHVNLFVGAPKAKMPFGSKDSDVGSLILCEDVLEDISKCKDTQHRVQKNIRDLRSYMGEGYGTAFSVATNGNMIVCAPFMKDVDYMKKYNYIFMPGRCVAFLNWQGKTVEKNIYPFYKKRYMAKKQYYKGLAGFGTSTDMYQNSIFAVGSPGLTIFEGGVTIIDYRHKERKLTHSSADYKNTLNSTAYGYLGYEVKFGRFCQPPTICLAAGAPQLNTVGVVRLYKWLNDESLVNFQTIEGEKTWSYFGSVLCTADTDGDKRDEIIVGAPYYTDSRDYPDIGKAYVYRRKSISKFFYLDQKLDGPRSKYGRFGSAIQVIGDVDLDGHNEIAISAPGEGSGCVYIYFGSENGLQNKYTQRICAQDIPVLKPDLMGFGSSISGPSPVPQNSYPVFAISAFPSDTVAIFGSKPILHVKASISGNPNPVDIHVDCVTYNEPCTLILVSLSQSVMDKQLTGDLQQSRYYNITMKVDTQTQSGRPKRAMLVTENGERVDNDVKRVLVKGAEKIVEYRVVISKKQLQKDRFTPVQLEMTYELDSDISKSSKYVLDPREQNKVYYMITFANDCGADNICKTDLKVQGQLVYSYDGDEPQVILGFTKKLIVVITISNTEEPCYWTEIIIKVSQPLVLSKFSSDKIRKCQTELDSTNSRGTAVVCNYYHPLLVDAPIKLSLTFEMDNLAEDKSKLTISAEAKPTDEKHNPEIVPVDNKIELMADVFIVAHIEILGVATPLEVTIKKAKKISPSDKKEVHKISTPKHDPINKILLNHKVLMKNKGPSFVPKTKVKLYVPIYTPDGTRLVTDIAVKLITGDELTDCLNSKGLPGTTGQFGISTTPSSNSGIEEETLTTSEDNIFSAPLERTQRKKREVESQHENNSSASYILTCDESPEFCLTFTCHLPKIIEPGGHAELNVTLTLDEDNIPMLEGYTTFQLELKTVLEQPDHKLFKPWNATNATSMQQIITLTTFHLYETGEEINLWIIIGSVLAGICLLIIINLVIWRFGFFERKRHFQVEKWRNESMKSRK